MIQVVEERVELRPCVVDEVITKQPTVQEDTHGVQTLPVGEIAREAVKYVPQTLTDEQKSIACQNIGLGEMDPTPVEIYEEAKRGN